MSGERFVPMTLAEKLAIPRAPDPTGRTISAPKGEDAYRILERARRTRTDVAQEQERAVGYIRHPADRRGVPRSSLYHHRTKTNLSSLFYYPIITTLPDGAYVSLERLRADVTSLLKLRLKSKNINPQEVDRHMPQWPLPISLDQQNAYRLLLEDPLSLPTNILLRMLHLQPSTANNKMTAKERKNFNKTWDMVYYIREFPMTAGEACKVLETLHLDLYDMHPNFYGWWERVRAMHPSDMIIFRYCGQTKNEPWDRHKDDVYSTSLKTFLSRFIRTVNALDPQLLVNAKVFEVVGARSPKNSSSELKNVTEQILIALFGDGVLNTEFGGKDVITLTDRNREVFLLLDSNTFAKIKPKTKKDAGGNIVHSALIPCTQEQQRKLELWATAVETYISENETTRKGADKMHQFTNQTKEMLMAQGKFQQLSDGSAVLVQLGSDLGDEHEDDEMPFFEAGGRSAEVLTTNFNHFKFWESPVQGFDRKATQKMAAEGLLTWTDYFSWFVKHKVDFLGASRLSAKFMNVTRPYIIVTYGAIPTYAASQNFEAFTENQHMSYSTSIQQRRGGGELFWLNNIFAVPKLRGFDRNANTNPDKTFVHYPCYHPGGIGHSGQLKDRKKDLINAHNGLLWDTYGEVIAIYDRTPRTTGYRRRICEAIIAHMKAKLDPSHPFGAAFKQMKREFLIASTADEEARRMRKLQEDLPKPEPRILEQKIGRNRQDKVDEDAVTVTALSKSFEVDIRAKGKPVAGCRQNYQLRWAEDDGSAQLLEPISFPPGVVIVDGGSNERRFVTYTATGIDIRDETGTSLGTRERMPNLVGSSKNETLPLSALVIMLQNNQNADSFFEHWESITGHSVNQVLGAKRGVADPKLIQSSDQYLPPWFFEKSATSGLPVLPGIKGVIHPGTRKKIIQDVKNRKPAKPGDFIWLFERFLAEVFPAGGHVDVVPGSLLPDSVYNKIADFCKRKTYMHHPHWRTMLALTSMPEMGLPERHLPANVVLIAVETLRKLSTTDGKPVNKSKKGTYNKMQYELSRQVLPLRSDSTCPEGIIAPIESLPWIQDVTEELDNEGGSELIREAANESDDDASLLSKGEISNKRKSGTTPKKLIRDGKLEAGDTDLSDDTALVLKRKQDKKTKKDKKSFRSPDREDIDETRLDLQQSECKKLEPKSHRNVRRDANFGLVGAGSADASSSNPLKTPAATNLAASAYFASAAPTKAEGKRKNSEVQDEFVLSDPEPVRAHKRRKKGELADASSDRSKSKSRNMSKADSKKG